MRAAVFVIWLLFVLLLLPLVVVAVAPAFAEDLPYPPGQSIQRFEDHRIVLVLPEDLSAEKPASLLIVLHGAGGTATGMAASFAGWAADGYVVCAPKATDQTWEPQDIRCVVRLNEHLHEVLPLHADRVHVVGYSNGGWNLGPLAFDDDVRARTATWIAAGYRGAQVPKWAKSTMGAIALAGSDDANNRAARQTVNALEDKVRTVEFREQPGIGHAFPRKLMPYLQWWMGVQEGRIVPGDDMSFEWTTDLDAAVASQADVKKGGVLVWLYAADDAEKEEAAILQREVFFDPEVRFLGNQIPCVKLDVAEHGAKLEAWRLKTTPALVVLDRKGKVKKTFEGKIKASKAARTLRGVVPQKRPPKR